MSGLKANRLLILGIGSRLMRDDGIGPALADALQREPCPGNWHICAAETDIAYAAGLRRAGDAIVLLDAVRAGNAPGTVYLAELQTEGWGKDLTASLHDPDAWRMVFQEPHAGGWLIGVEAGEISHGIGLSETLDLVFAETVVRVKAELQEISRSVVYTAKSMRADYSMY